MNSTAPIIDRDIRPRDIVEIAVLTEQIRAINEERVQVTVRSKRGKRKPSQEQFGYHHAVVEPLAVTWFNETQGGVNDGFGGFRDAKPKEVHEWLKRLLKIGTPVHDPRTGEEIDIITPSCADMKPMQMFAFTEAVASFLKDQNINVPPPDKEWREARDKARREAQ